MKQRIEHILAAMRSGLYERDEVLALSLLSALAGESIFLLGPPGVGKSMVARRLKTAFDGARSFEYLMSRFSTPDEIFGPVSISKLKEEDTYQRITAGYLPEAEIVFLDEIWKAGPAIQNALLTVLNEKIYLNGNTVVALPLRGIISASNELPAEGEGLEALWDRFIIRYVVNPIADRENFGKLLCDKSVCLEITPLTTDECDAIAKRSCTVIVPETLIDVLYAMRTRLNDKMLDPEGNPAENRLQYYVSDRRWAKAVGIMRTSAAANDRDAVDYSDLLLLVHMLWNEEAQRSEILQLVCNEIITCLYRQVLDKHKSNKRHASTNAVGSLYSPDGMHYVIACDGFNLQLRISDYDEMLHTGEFQFASETNDERLVIMPGGTCTIQVRQPGAVNINGYNYPLATSVDPQINTQGLNSMISSVDGMSAAIFRQISHNIFIDENSVGPTLKALISRCSRKL